MAIRKSEDSITIIVDDKEFNGYRNYCEFHYPRKKFILKDFMWSSLNVWTNQNKYKKNDIKQEYGNFIKYIIDKYELQNENIGKTSLECKFFFKTKHRKDLDNLAPKFFLDGLVNCGFLEDDSCEKLNPLILSFGGYDKENPRVEATFKF